MEELEELIPNEEIITVGGAEVIVSPVRARQFSQFARHARSIWHYMESDEIDINGLLENGTEEAIKLCATATELSEQKVGDLQMDELVRLLVKVIEVNADFLCRNVLPQARQALTMLHELSALRSTGMTSSSN